MSVQSRVSRKTQHLSFFCYKTNTSDLALSLQHTLLLLLFVDHSSFVASFSKVCPSHLYPRIPIARAWKNPTFAQRCSPKPPTPRPLKTSYNITKCYKLFTITWRRTKREKKHLSLRIAFGGWPATAFSPLAPFQSRLSAKTGLENKEKKTNDG